MTNSGAVRMEIKTNHQNRFLCGAVLQFQNHYLLWQAWNASPGMSCCCLRCRIDNFLRANREDTFTFLPLPHLLHALLSLQEPLQSSDDATRQIDSRRYLLLKQHQNRRKSKMFWTFVYDAILKLSSVAPRPPQTFFMRVERSVINFMLLHRLIINFIARWF